MIEPLAALALGGPTVALGLASAASWGTADFGGGILSRRSPLFGVVFLTQLVGMALALGIAIVRREPLPGGADLAWSVASGVLGAIGILGLYRGLAVGRMGVVAPITGVLGASVPVAVGIVLQGLPQQVVLVGIALAFVAVVLVSRASDDGETSRPPGIEYALLGGLGIGLFNVTISRVSEGFVFGPLTVVRAVEAILLVAIITASRSGWRVERRLAPIVIVVGLLDMAGNAFFILAAQSGPLAVASVLSSLYPVATVILATVVLREPLTRAHAAGIVAAAAAIGLIAAGSG